MAAGSSNSLAVSEPPTILLQDGERGGEAFSTLQARGRLADRQAAITRPVSLCGEQSDVAQVEEKLREFFDALARNDEAGLAVTVTDDFTLFENGEVWSVQKLINEIFGSGERTWTLSEVTVVARGDVAHIAYRNQGTLAADRKPIRRREYLESALLVKDRGAWRIMFLHSTPLSDQDGKRGN